MSLTMNEFSDPIGSIRPFVGDRIPPGWERCNGGIVETQWSPMVGVKKPPMGLIMIIKVANIPELDGITQAIFDRPPT